MMFKDPNMILKEAEIRPISPLTILENEKKAEIFQELTPDNPSSKMSPTSVTSKSILSPARSSSSKSPKYTRIQLPVHSL